MPQKITAVLARSKRKIRAINEDVLNSRGLTEDEADAAIETELIAADQKYWWLEDWQKRYRKAEEDIRKGRIQEFDSPEAFLNAL